MRYYSLFKIVSVGIKNYSPEKHKDSFVISIKKKKVVLYTLQKILPYLKIPTKIKRAELIIYQYKQATPRNGKYSKEVLIKKK